MNLILYFYLVPPPNKDGSINTDILSSAIKDIDDVSTRDNYIVIRSTVTPGTTRRLQQEYHQLNLLFNPEFLTERSANFDFINQSRFIIGSGDSMSSASGAENFEELLKARFGKCIAIMNCTYETAEMIKYMSNCFFATKVSFMNEMYQIAEKSNVNWQQAIDGLVADGRIGHSHMNVLGPDGKFGFGGSCFPKDIQA